MLKWRIAMGGYEIDLDRVDDEDIQDTVRPFRDHISQALAALKDEDISVVFTVGEDREFDFMLRGDTYAVNRARDLLGDRAEVDPKLN